ncbi:MAG: peptidylprolyl isomerase [Gammaproteobacteria bacterium]|nr:peptidylprolyl isomerase [Gammaproteobacteria bacterium]
MFDHVPFNLILRARRTVGLILALVALACMTVVAPRAQTNDPPRVVPLDRIVAVVNDDVIVETELRARLAEVSAQLRNSNTALPSRDVLARQVLERMVLDLLQVQLARSTGIKVEDEELNQAILRIAEQNKLSLRDFRAVLERDGYDYASFREQIRREMLIARVRQQQVERRVNVSSREVDNFLAHSGGINTGGTQYRLGHILLAVPEQASADDIASARERGEAVLRQLADGEDFARTAVAYSSGPNALQGGDLGWREGGNLPPFLLDAVAGLQEGQVSGLIRSPNGFHIVKLLGKRGEDRIVVEQIHAQHILIKLTELVDDAEAQRRLEVLRERIVNGEDFADIARAHSDDTTSAMRGGDLGWLNPGDTVPEFERQMHSLASGGVSRPFRTQFGWHIVQVVERREHDDTDQVKRARATERIRARKLDEEYQSWLRQLRDEAYVEIRLDDV